MPKVPSLPHRPRQSIDSQAVGMWTTLKKRSPHAHSHNKCKCQARSDIDQEAAVRFTSIRHITHIRRAPPTDSPEEARIAAPSAPRFAIRADGCMLGPHVTLWEIRNEHNADYGGRCLGGGICGFHRVGATADPARCRHY